MDEASEDEIPNEAVVVRGGVSALKDVKTSVASTLAKQRRRGEREEALLSVFTHPTDDATTIAQRAPILTKWSKIRLTTAGALRARGFAVSLPDDLGHASVKLPDSPSDDDYKRFLDALDAPIPNPACKD